MKILITGGAGYIGSHTALNLLEKGNNLEVIDSLCNSYPKVLERVEHLKKRGTSYGEMIFHQGDIRDTDLVEKIFKKSFDKKQPIEAVIHFAGLKSVSESIKYPEKYWDFNVHGSKVLLKIMDKYECRNIVFSSSATVYKFLGLNEFLTEAAKTNPINPYGETKLEVEKILKALFKKEKNIWRISILRYFNPIGAHFSGMIGEDPQGFPNNLFPLITKAASGEMDKLQIYGNDWPTADGTAIRDYIHVMDLAEAHYLALKNLMEYKSKLSILNIGTGIGTSVLEIVKTFESVNKCSIPYEFADRREGDCPFVVADNKLSLKTLNWSPKLNLKRMCIDGWNWKLKNPNGYSQ